MHFNLSALAHFFERPAAVDQALRTRIEQNVTNALQRPQLAPFKLDSLKLTTTYNEGLVQNFEAVGHSGSPKSLAFQRYRIAGQQVMNEPRTAIDRVRVEDAHGNDITETRRSAVSAWSDLHGKRKQPRVAMF